MKVLVAIDGVFELIWQWPIRTWIGLTGTSSKTLAIIVAVCTAGTSIVLGFSTIQAGLPESLVRLIMAIFFVMCSKDVYDWTKYRPDNSDVISANQAIMTFARSLQGGLFISLLWSLTLIRLFGARIDPYVWGLYESLAIFAAYYFATNNKPRKPSWLQRGYEIAKQRISGIGTAPRWNPGVQGA